MSLLKSSGLFVVNQDDINYAISTDVLKEYIAPLAKQELGDPYSPGQPGLIMPGDGFFYDETTGLLEINFPEGIVYVGLIGTDTLNDEVLEPDYYGDVPGHFYIVAEEVTLCNDVWPGITKDPSGCREVHINDKVIMNNDEDWDVIPAISEDFIHVGDTPPSDPDEGNLWWDSDADEMTLFIYVYDAYGTGMWLPAAPPTSLDGINATIKSALIVQDEILSRVDAGEVAQATLQTTVQTALQTQEDILNQLAEIDSQPDIDSKVDKNGDTMTGHLKVTNSSAASGTYLFSVEAPLLESDKQVAFRVTGNGRVKVGHDANNAFMAIDANDVITKNYIDEKVVGTTGIQTLDTSLWKLRQPDSDGVIRNFIEIEDENMKLFHVQDPTNGSNEWAANKGYVDTVGNKKISKTGTSTVSGDIVFTPSSGYNAFKMRLDGENTLKLWNSAGESRLHIEPGKVFKLTTNVNGSDVQTLKVYESGKIRISNHLTPLESSDVANRQYVDDAIASALAAPARLSWKYQVPTSGKGPADGTFWRDGNHYRFSLITHNGVNLGFTKPALRDEWNASAVFEMTIWVHHGGSNWKYHDHVECDKTRWLIEDEDGNGIKHFQFRWKWASHDVDLVENGVYYITVGGFF
jgi:hypothetical protein